jgi:hypothetical protein
VDKLLSLKYGSNPVTTNGRGFMKTKIAILFTFALAFSARCTPNLSISYLGVTNNNVFNETAPTIRLTAKNESPGAMEYVYWTTNLSLPKSQWVLVWVFTATGTDAVNLAIPFPYNQVYFVSQEQ